ncbi:hypothetical protein LJR260_004312 [Variovorax paradoxus]|uniref:tetratricopeptide repeat protein n=1 Tax=Variovorax paradoxus TaxID=34073 RepID=UPI003ECFA6FB
MKTLELFIRSSSARCVLAITAIGAASLAITGCAGLKDQYAASTDAQQRLAAEMAADTKAGASVDTQATYLKLVEQMQKEDLWFASLAHIGALEQRWGVSPESTRLRAEALRQTGQAALAEAAYKHLLGTSMESAGYRGLGLLAGTRGNFTEAVQLLAQAQRRTPTDALLLSDLGYAHLRAGQIEEARLPLMQALQLRPDSTQAQANLALYLEVINQRDRATALMDANRMSETTRLAVREAALQMLAPGASSSLAAPITPSVRISTTALGSASSGASAFINNEPIAEPLALKRSRWSGSGGARTAGLPNPASANPAGSLSPNSSISRGIQ